MGTQTKEATSELVHRSQEGLSEEEIGRLAEKPGWTAKEAAELLWSQQYSALNVPKFADKYGFSRSRLYYWKKRLAQTPETVCSYGEEIPETEDSVTAPSASVDDERELDAETLKGALLQELATDSAGDRRVERYVMRAVRVEDKMWSVFAVPARGRVLWCVVRWEGKEAGTCFSAGGTRSKGTCAALEIFLDGGSSDGCTPEADRSSRGTACSEERAQVAAAAPSSSSESRPRNPSGRSDGVHTEARCQHPDGSVSVRHKSSDSERSRD